MAWKSKAARDEYRRKNRLKIKLQQQDYQRRNRAQIAANKRKKTRTQSPEERREAWRTYYHKNKEAIKVKRKQHYQDNRNLIVRRNAARRRKNKKYVNERQNAYRLQLRIRQVGGRLQDQDFKCANSGCQVPLTLNTAHNDHCHKTNIVRGLLCHGCNTAAGLLLDDPARCIGLSNYLTKWATITQTRVSDAKSV